MHSAHVPFTSTSIKDIKPPLAIASLRLYAMCLSICLSVRSSVAKMCTQKQDFLKS